MMATFNQLSGLNAINFYSSTLFETVFTDDENAVKIGKALSGVA